MFTIYKDRVGDYRWRFRHTDGQSLADSVEGYKTKEDCLHNLNLVKEVALSAIIEDNTN